MDLSEKIPAFLMWKMLNETITPALLNCEYPESSLQKLGHIVKYKEFSNIFVYNHGPSVSFEEYQDISDKYKAFTLWLLGRFFYLLSCDRLNRMHDLITDTQLRILHTICITQPDIYADLTLEYTSALKQLNKYHRDTKDQMQEFKITLELFQLHNCDDLKSQLDLNSLPVELASKKSCAKMQKRVLKFIHYIIVQNIELRYYDEVIYENMDSLLYIIAECDLELKFIVLQIIADVLSKDSLRSATPKLIEEIKTFFNYLEQLTYDIYSKRINVSRNDFENFEEILIVVMNNPKSHVKENNQSVFTFVACRTLNKNLQELCLKEIKGPIQVHFSMKDCISSVLEDKCHLLNIIQKNISEELSTYSNKNDNLRCNLFAYKASATWSKLHEEVLTLMQWNNSYKENNKSVIANLSLFHKILQMLLRIKLEILPKQQVHFFEENKILSIFLNFVRNITKLTVEMEILLQQIFIVLPFTYIVTDLKLIFYLTGYQLFKYSDCVSQHKDYSESANQFLALLFATNLNSKETATQNLASLICKVSSKFVAIQNCARDIEVLKASFFNVIVGSKKSELIPSSLLQFPNIFDNSERYWANNFFIPILQRFPPTVAVLQAAFDFICKSCSGYVQVLLYNPTDCSLKMKTFCVTCTKSSRELQEDEVVPFLEKRLAEDKDYKTCLFGVSEVFSSLKKDDTVLKQIVQLIVKSFKQADEKIKLNIIKGLLPLLHVKSFHTIETTKLWLAFARDSSKNVRIELSKVILTLMKDIQCNGNLSKEYKKEVLRVCFDKLKEESKLSLQQSDYELQDTLLKTIEKLSELKADEVLLHTANNLLIFIMIPTSKHSLIATNIFIELAAKHNTTTKVIYLQYHKQICRTIVHLCALNQSIANYTLASSLEKVSLILGFFGAKDFITQECQYLLPFLISLTIQFPQIGQLIEEVATFAELNLSDLLINCYGKIFLRLFLNETDDNFKKAMTYVEKNTGLTGILLRKKNFHVIFHELLLNFHEKRDRVLLALRILAGEDSDSQILSEKQIPEYLQPKFLGVLAHFDIKLVAKHSNKENVLLSLTQLLKFMGPKYITPLRFKILAMLRTALNLNHDAFPEINCNVWDAFVRNCEIDALGPQLALIFVSLIPLLQHFPKKIEDIFRYLVVENESYLKDYILDLFFVPEMKINMEICVVILRHLQKFESLSFKDQLKTFLKYLNYETVDVRVHSLKYLKRLLEKHREELDQMILGYNGIDSTVVELLNILMVACRGKEKSLILACGECIGELGALEPSHLPREYTQEDKSFTFYVTEDNFIIGALNELTRALQAEKNTQSMNRFSLAIQEILKVHEISPDESSAKNHLWINIPEAQRELMLPLLSSKYTMIQSLENIEVSPIYGSKFGTTFQTWIYNWTCSLILSIRSNERSWLQVCLPSFKQDHSTLMYFLPHILLHTLLENDNNVHHKVHEEFIAVIDSFSNKQNLNSSTLNVDSTNSPLLSQVVSQEEIKEKQCIRVIFVLLDFLDRWIRECAWEKNIRRNTRNERLIIKEFLSRFCRLRLARCNYLCEEYPRALMYLEEYIKEQPNCLNQHFEFLAKLYAQLDEPDGVAGVTALQTTEPPLEQRLLALEVSGKLADAAACYERIHPPLKPYHIQGLVQCYLELDNVNTALNFVEGAINRQPEYKHILFEAQAESLWRLSRYTELDDLLKKPELSNNGGWSVEIGQALLHLKNGDRDEFKFVLDNLRAAQVESLGAASLKEGAYRHGYSYVAKLHAINELQQVEQMIYELLTHANDSKVLEKAFKQLTSEWELRLKIVQESIRIQEPILRLRRVTLEQAKNLLQEKVPRSGSFIDSLLAELWLHSGKTARAAGVHQQAYTYILKAEEYAPPRLFLEKAKLQWLREEHEQALTTLRRGLEELLPEGLSSPSSSFSQLTAENKKIAAEAKLLIATYNDSISNVDTDVNTYHYKEAVEVFPEWEKSMICLAQYYDRIFHTFSDNDKDAKGNDIQINMIVFFGKSLLYGTNYVYQSLPRLLSIWFDYGTRLLDVSDSSVREERTNTLLKMTKIVDTFLNRLPAYIFLTAFSQLVSRICHPQKQVYIELKSIIIKLILQYPQQTLWMIISVMKSSYAVRSRRCAEILNDSHLKTSSMIKLVGDFTKLAEKLIELCNKEPSDSLKVTTVSQLMRSLPRLLAKEDFSEIMIPTQKFLKLILPNPDFKSSQHNPFPNNYVHIAGIEEQVTILQSLQKPKKIAFRGSDGKLYIHMLKPKDDLRKDFRLMEFNDIVNQLLSREADSRQRRLNIRLYSVVPLNEECGLIEWIPNLIGLRPILLTIYKQTGMGIETRELRQFGNSDTLIKKREIFTNNLLPRHPPVLGEWFRKTFPDAQSWLTARTAYIRTTAVISMVGYILGLGDRHGENILFDSACGDTVHVDFNCLFNKGETFQVPERVPFRLTHNMVGAMGPLGVEGPFRKSCACTLRVLRMNSNTLMSIVTPFVYDPLVTWHKDTLSTANAQIAERTNKQAVEHIRNIELRLQGKVRTKGRAFSIPLSIEGQTNNLIQEAMNIDNLCQMYIGWGPYL